MAKENKVGHIPFFFISPTISRNSILHVGGGCPELCIKMIINSAVITKLMQIFANYVLYTYIYIGKRNIHNKGEKIAKKRVV